MTYNIQLEKEALSSLRQIISYIRFTLRSPRAADNFKNKFIQKIDLLAKEPHMEQIMALPHNEKYRKILINNYIAIFYINEKEKTVYVTHVLYGGQNYSELL